MCDQLARLGDELAGAIERGDVAAALAVAGQSRGARAAVARGTAELDRLPAGEFAPAVSRLRAAQRRAARGIALLDAWFGRELPPDDQLRQHPDGTIGRAWDMSPWSRPSRCTSARRSAPATEPGSSA